MTFYGGNTPLFYSVFPGVLALALVASVGRPRSRAAWWALLVCLVGLFFALGAWNPVVRLLYHLPGASALRFPVKFWLAVALGGSLLCGIAFERIGESRRRLAIPLALLGALYLGMWLLFRQAPEGLTGEEAVIARFVHQLLREKDLSDDAFGAAKNLLGERGVVDLTLTVSYYTALALAQTSLRLEMQPGRVSTL